jgi:hypothetical protein
MAVRNNEVDGASIAFTSPANIFSSPIFSSMCWCNLYSGGSNPSNRGILTAWDNPSNQAWALRSDDSGALVFRGQISFDGSSSSTALGTTVLALDTWNHLGIDFDGTDLNIWLNGIFEATLNDPGTIFDTNEGFGIGGTGDGGNQMDDEIADARYYDRILSAAEWLTISTVRGHDGIVDGLVCRAILDDDIPGVLVTTTAPLDQGPQEIPYFRSYGAPRPTYVLDGGLSFRKRV